MQLQGLLRICWFLEKYQEEHCQLQSHTQEKSNYNIQTNTTKEQSTKNLNQVKKLLCCIQRQQINLFQDGMVHVQFYKGDRSIHILSTWVMTIERLFMQTKSESTLQDHSVVD